MTHFHVVLLFIGSELAPPASASTTCWLFLLPALLAHPALPKVEGPLTSGPDLLFCSFLGPYIWMGRKGGSRILSCEGETLTQGHAPGGQEGSAPIDFQAPSVVTGLPRTKWENHQSSPSFHFMCEETEAREEQRPFPESLQANGRAGAQALVPSPSPGKAASRTSVALGSIVEWANEGMQ